MLTRHERLAVPSMAASIAEYLAQVGLDVGTAELLVIEGRDGTDDAVLTFHTTVDTAVEVHLMHMVSHAFRKLVVALPADVADQWVAERQGDASRRFSSPLIPLS